MIDNLNFDSLTQIFTLNEFNNLKPIILLLGLTKLNNIQACKRLILCLCLNSAKESLVNKLGNLIKTYLDFITWLQSLPNETKKRDIKLNDLLKRLLNIELPLNILNEYTNLDLIDSQDVVKVLKNTLLSQEATSEPKAKIVRFKDDVNESISSIQKACLSIYNGFYCIKKIIDSITYCNNNLHEKLFETKRNVDTAQIKNDEIQSEYNDFIIENLNSVRKILNKIEPFKFRLEIIENIYSLIYLMTSHLKDDNDDEEEHNEIEFSDSQISQPDLDIETSFNKDNLEFNSIYGNANNRSRASSCAGLSQKSDIRTTDESDFARKNGTGGGDFLVNEFLCRDILYVLRDTLLDFRKNQRTSNSDIEIFINCSIDNNDELNSKLNKLNDLVNETLWRFQLVKPNWIKNEYGSISLVQNIDSSTQSEEAIAYSILKKLRNQNKLSKKLESQKSLSLILSHQPRNYNRSQIIMKLLADSETLCVICLKEQKLSGANELVLQALNEQKESLVFDQVKLFGSYEDTVVELKKIDDCKLKISTNLITNDSLMAVELSKRIEELRKKIKPEFLSDLVVVSEANSIVNRHLINFIGINTELNDEINEIKSFLKQMDDVLENNESLKVTDLIIDLNGIQFLNHENTLLAEYKIFQEYIQLNGLLNAYKQQFEEEQRIDSEKETIVKSMLDKLVRTDSEKNGGTVSQHEIYQQIIQLISNALVHDSLVDKYFIKKTSDFYQDSNYVSLFYDYCKTLYEYFLDKESLSALVTNSYFSILKSSPASLICKLIFQDDLRPQLIEPLTKKLNLNLTCIILHNSCPRLKLTRSIRNVQVNNQISVNFDNYNNGLLNDNCFYTILNESNIHWCSLQSADQLVYSILNKLLSYLRKSSSNRGYLTLEEARSIYTCSEFKTIVNESRQLKFINLNTLKNDKQKLSFFINIYNLLVIHSNIFFASIRFKSLTNSFIDEQATPDSELFAKNFLFNNTTETLLFKRRMSYYIGQLGCVSLTDLEDCLLNEHLKSEPIWEKYLPKKNDYRVIFTMINCRLTDPPLSALNSDGLLNDQLDVQMNMYLNHSIKVYLNEKTLYVSQLIVDYFKNDLVKFLLDNLKKPLVDDLKCLLDDTLNEPTIEMSLNSEEFSIILNFIEKTNQKFTRKMSKKDGTFVSDSIESPIINVRLTDNDKKKLNKDCIDYIETNAPLIANTLSFLFNSTKQQDFFNNIRLETNDDRLSNYIRRFVLLNVPLEFFEHVDMNNRLNLIAQFLLRNKADESKIELVVTLADYYVKNEEWLLVLELVNSCIQYEDELIARGLMFTDLDENISNYDVQTEAKLEVNTSKFTLSDLYNLHDYACLSAAIKFASTNEQSHQYLFKIRNFNNQLKYCLTLLHLWTINGCLEILEFLISKIKLFNFPQDSLIREVDSNYNDYLKFLNDKKKEFEAFKELTECARLTAEKYFDEENEIELNIDIDKRELEKICQKCLKWQSAKLLLEQSDDQQNLNLIFDILLYNNKFSSAKYFSKKLNCNRQINFSIDYLHLKYFIQNINSQNANLNSIDFSELMKSQEDFGHLNKDEYLFEIFLKLFHELKTTSKSSLIVVLSEHLLINFNKNLNATQKSELLTIQLSHKIFLLALNDSNFNLDAYIKLHNQPLVVIEQLLMNSKIDLCIGAVKLVRESSLDLRNDLNKILVSYAQKALVFKEPEKQKIKNEVFVESKSPIFKKNSLLKKASLSIAFASSSPLRTSNFKYGRFSLATPPNSFINSSSLSGSVFEMPDIAPTKDQWIKDEDVDVCMVCNVEKFNLITRRHHCRRCGRVVCSNCSKKETIINEILQRTCDDCYKALETQKKQSSLTDNSDDFPNKRVSTLRKSSKMVKSLSKSRKLNELLENKQSNDWTLSGIDENDKEIREKFHFNQAPSASLCLSILDIHDEPIECGKHLLKLCDDLSCYLSTANYMVEDFSLIINMMKYLLCNAKIKLISSQTSLVDNYLNLIDILEQLLLANCETIPSLNELRNIESARMLRNKLLEEERHELAMNLSTKCGIDTQTVLASWGMTELRRGNYKEARNKFEKCLKVMIDKNASLNQAQIKTINDILTYLEQAPPIRINGPQTLLAPLKSMDILIAEPILFSTDDSNMDELQYKEAIFYLETYANHLMIVTFYQKHGYLQKALKYILDNKCQQDVFIEALLIPCLRRGEFHQLLDNMLLLDRTQQKFHSYFISIGKYLEKNSFSNTLYDFQLFTKDYIRACMSCVYFFSKSCLNYAKLANNLHFLNKARTHLEQYLEIKSQQQTQHQQTLGWNNTKSTSDSQLCKQMNSSEIQNYLNAINLQIEITKFLSNTNHGKKVEALTVFGNNEIKVNICCKILLAGETIQDGFGFVIRIIECFNLSSTLVYSQIARDLAKEFNFKEINNLLKCINESGYKQEEINLSNDEVVSSCLRVFAATSSQNQQQYNKEIEDLIQQIKDENNKINAYILTGRLKLAYFIAIKMEKSIELVQNIANIAERIGQNNMRDICNKWLEKNQPKKT